MFQSLSLLPSVYRGLMPPVSPTFYRRSPALIRSKTAPTVAFAARDGIPAKIAELQKPNPIHLKNHSSSSVSAPTNHFARSRSLGFQPSPELGLLSLLFVLSTAIGAVLSLAIISIPALTAFRKLAASMDKLSKVVSEEVPGTLSSLKLSGLEINDLTQLLGNIRQKIPGNQHGRKDGSNRPSFKGGRENPIAN